MSNLSQIKRNRMKSFLETLKNNSSDDDQIKAINEISTFLDEKRYGLVWEEHEEKVDIMMRDNIPVFTEDESKKIIKDERKPMNFLLEGDNLHSLYLLEKTHKNLIDVIYIDPPYNTKKEGFTYDDSLVNDNDGFRHSKWLSFMERRLRVAKELLTDDGCIFISIDENEFAQLKQLMDSVFSESCFVECLVWNKRVPKNDKGIGNIHEYILLYTKAPDSKKIFMVEKDKMDEIFSLVNRAKEEGKSLKETESLLRKYYQINNFPRAITLYNNLDNNYRIYGKINMSWPNGNTVGPKYEVLHPKTNKPVKIPDRGWRWTQTTFEDKLDNQNIQELHDGSFLYGKIWFSKDENTQTSSINYLEDTNKMLLSSIISLKSDGGMELERIFGKKNIFSYPKPTSLIERLLTASTYDNPEARILDFFAGSGTTGHAVLKLNKKDKGKRTFILATNNEANIAHEVAFPRLEAVAKGFLNEIIIDEVIFRKKLTVSDIQKPQLLEKKVQKAISENSDSKDKLTHQVENGEYLVSKEIHLSETEKFIFNLKYFKTDYISRFQDEESSLTDELLDHIKEMAELEFGVDLATSHQVKLVLDEEELDNFFNEIQHENMKLLIPTFVLLKGKQKVLAEERNITVIPVPDYYFASELKEAGEL